MYIMFCASYGKQLIVLLVILHLSIPIETVKLNILLLADDNLKILPRFWTNTGFCPPRSSSSVNPQDSIRKFLLSNDVKFNLEIISSLPNNGFNNIRIHWLLELLKIQHTTSTSIVYEYKDLDDFIKFLSAIQLNPTIELMGNPSNIFLSNKQNLWKNLLYQIITRYISKYGIDKINEWKLETWNEPDLKVYNILNYTFSDYLNYLNNVSVTLKTIAEETDLKLQLHGPAGLFKNEKIHPLCWGILNICNQNITTCPIDIITYHRKGNGSAEEILNGTHELLNNINNKFPNLSNMKISNSEADPIAGWSTPLSIYSNLDYAIISLEIILKHWNVIYFNEFKNFHLNSISHDNAFLSYYPWQFEQRTLLARFQMNLTDPPHVQFIQKPIFAIFGLLSNLGRFSDSYKLIGNNISYLMTTSKQNKYQIYYNCIILNNNQEIVNKSIQINIKFTESYDGLLNRRNLFKYFVEYLAVNRTDPVNIWETYGKPFYPNESVRQEMRNAQGPHILYEPRKVIRTREMNYSINLKICVNPPWIISVRICNYIISKPRKIHNIHIRRVNSQEILIFWKEKFSYSRCTKTYEIFYKEFKWHKWMNITKRLHVPFLSYQYRNNYTGGKGHYKIRAIDIFNRKGAFSKIFNYYQ